MRGGSQVNSSSGMDQKYLEGRGRERGEGERVDDAENESVSLIRRH
jgi:hypothetical protein